MNSAPVDYLAVAEATGPDAADFLQAQLSADLTTLRENRAGLACYCNAKGRVIAVTLVVRKADRFLLVMNRSLLQPVLELLRRYVLRAEVDLSPTSMEVCGLQVPSGQAGEITVECGSRSLTYRLSGSKEDEAGDSQALASEWRALELQSGLAWLGPETSERYLPQMLGLDRIGAVSFRKGCFPGQEVIARARYLGQVKRTSLIIETGGNFTPAPDSAVELLDRQGAAQSARVVDAARSGGKRSVLFLVSSAGPEFEPVEVRLGEEGAQARRLDQR